MEEVENSHQEDTAVLEVVATEDTEDTVVLADMAVIEVQVVMDGN